MPSFEIPDGPTNIDATRSAESSAVFNVTNTTSSAIGGRLTVRVSGASRDEWFTVDGNRERTFEPGETQTATIRVRFPVDAPEGNYPFQLRVVAVNDPDNDYAEGPTTLAKLGPGVRRKSLLWLWILLALLAVAAVGGGIYWWLNREKPVEEEQPAALTTEQALRLAEKKTAAWWSAISSKDVDTLVRLSPPPFYWDQGILLDEAQIRSKYSGMFDNRVERTMEKDVPVGDVTVNPEEATARSVDEAAPPPPPPPPSERGLVDESPAGTERGLQEIHIDKLMAYTIGDLRKNKPEYLANDRVLNAMKLGDDDIAVIVIYGGEGTIHFFRRSARDVQMAGFWN